MRTFRFLLLSLSFFTAAGFVTAEGVAQEDDDAQADPASAELVQRGIAMRRAGKDEAALQIFLDAERQSPNSVRVLLHITAAAQATGRWLMAHQYLQKAAAFQSDPYYQRYRAAIKNIEDAVAQRVGQFRALGSPEGAEVFLNGEPVGALPMTSALTLEVGSYTLEVRKAGYYPMKRPISVAAGGALVQEAVELKKQDPAAMLVQGAGGTPEQRSLAGTSSASDQTGIKAPWVTWTLAGAGAALAVTSGIAFYVREDEADHWNDDSRCLDGARTREEVCGDVRDRANSAERIGIVSGVLAVGFGGAAVVHWLWARDSNQAVQGSAGLTARCDPGLGGILCHGTF